MTCKYCGNEMTEEEARTPTGQEEYCFGCASENMLMMGYTEAEAYGEYFGKEESDAPDG